MLLHACVRLRESLGLPLQVVHIDHGLHPNARAWAQHCRSTCAGLGLPLVVKPLRLRLRAGLSEEAQARDARYHAFAELLGSGEAIATAHHLDDQAETLLLALLRGSGVHGLAAMPESAMLGQGLLLRPLLRVDRAGLFAYAQRHGLSWVDDPGNQRLDLDRNRIRHQVLPLLRERWPAVSRTIARSAGHCAEAALTIDCWADQELAALAGRCSGSLSVSALISAGPRASRQLLRRWIGRRGFRPPSAARLERVLTEVLPARADAQPLVAWDGCEVRRYRDDLFALAPLPEPPRGDLVWSQGETLDLPGGLGRLRLQAAPPGPLRVRFMQPGLSCSALGRPRRPLAKLFQEAGVPSWLRPLVPRVLDTEGRLLLVPGLCGCALPEEAVRWERHPWETLGCFGKPGA